jgi:hypothetical protein
MRYSNVKKKHLFLDISSTNADTLVPSLYQSVETSSIEVFRLLSQTLPHLSLDLIVIRETFLDPVVNRFTRQTLPTINRKHFFMVSFALSPFAHKKGTTERCHSDY